MDETPTAPRAATVERATKETSVRVSLDNGVAWATSRALAVRATSSVTAWPGLSGAVAFGKPLSTYALPPVSTSNSNRRRAAERLRTSSA